jgi:hypothetical protein
MKLFNTNAKQFRIEMEHDRQIGNLLDIAPDGQWYVAGPAISEIKEISSFSLRLYDRKKGIVSRAMSVYNDTKGTLFIGDIESDIENKGYGSILIVNLVKIAKMLGVSSITGNLSEADSGHFDKLEHFYKQHGFVVKINTSSKTGSIYRKMP